jgi:glutathione S-transferase
MLEFVALPYSPWSEKARWALDHHRVPYREVLYQPLIGEPAMRFRQRRWTGRVSVPVLFDGSMHYDDSRAIALYAEGVGRGTPLFPDRLMAQIEHFEALSEQGGRSARALTLHRILESKELLSEMLPTRLGRTLGGAATAMAAFGVRRTLRKYGADALSLAEHEAQLVSVLDEIRAALGGLGAEPGGPSCLLGGFTYADICVSQVLQGVSPVADRAGGFRVGRELRRATAVEQSALAARYRDLLDWRDALYGRDRPAKVESASDRPQAEPARA